MSASEQPREWLDAGFWEKLDRLESRRRRAHSQHECAQRDLERLKPNESAELRLAWDRYCEVIAELERAATDIETLHSCTS